MQQQSIGFGSGVMILTPSISGAVTPVQLGTMQDVSIDIAFGSKQLFGQYQFPVALARGEAKISGKCKFANIDGNVLNNIFLGDAGTTGQKYWAYQEAHSIPATPYQVTVANSAKFDADLGVTFVSNGQPLTRVASGPATGQYSVAAGVYTFAAADTGKALLISYSYTSTATGQNNIITNNLMGSALSFQVDFYQAAPNVAGAQWSLRLYNCISNKLTLQSKTTDFTIPEMDFEAYANAANAVGEINTAT
jgi:hypothetical protein